MKNRYRRFFKALKKAFTKKRLKTFDDNDVVLVPGCVLKCDLGVLLEHTGIYVGKGKIVSLNRHGQIKTETPQTFFPPGTNPKSSKIYVACYGKTGEVLAAKYVARNAKRKIDDKTRYNVLFNNCHRFTAGCITGNFESDVISFSQLEEVILMYIEQLRRPPSLWHRFVGFFSRKKPLVQEASFHWRPAKINAKG